VAIAIARALAHRTRCAVEEGVVGSADSNAAIHTHTARQVTGVHVKTRSYNIRRFPVMVFVAFVASVTAVTASSPRRRRTVQNAVTRRFRDAF
jgi:hypothetical protein